MFQLIKQFLKPDWRKTLVFLIFLFIAFGGHTLSYVFSDGEERGLLKPPLFDLFSRFLPFLWVVWVFLLMPLHLLSSLLVAIGGYEADFVMRGPFWLFVIIQLIYFYLFSSLIIFIWDKLTKKR